MLNRKISTGKPCFEGVKNYRHQIFINYIVGNIKLRFILYTPESTGGGVTYLLLWSILYYVALTQQNMANPDDHTHPCCQTIRAPPNMT